MNDPVGITEIADRINVTGPAVQNWIARHPDFPAPEFRLAQGGVWEWKKVATWAFAHGKIPLTSAYHQGS